jgi:hypothetical protein
VMAAVGTSETSVNYYAAQDSRKVVAVLDWNLGTQHFFTEMWEVTHHPWVLMVTAVRSDTSRRVLMVTASDHDVYRRVNTGEDVDRGPPLDRETILGGPRVLQARG